jgi:Delta3-Delta2-enoyl-CoA isomerase
LLEEEVVMSNVTITNDKQIATVTLSRGKVNALNEAMVEEIHDGFRAIETDGTVKAVILTGQGKFFTFGFDIPEFVNYSKESFSRYLRKFSGLYTYMFTFPKPIIAALNGHTIAGGCMLAAACDYRLVITGKARISLNEINFGSSVFAGSVAMLKYCVGDKNAQEILYSGKMYSAEDAARLGLVDKVATEEDLASEALRVAQDLGGKDAAAFRSVKSLLRAPVAEEMTKREEASLSEFIDIWYSESTWKNLQEIKIAN